MEVSNDCDLNLFGLMKEEPNDTAKGLYFGNLKKLINENNKQKTHLIIQQKTDPDVY